MTDREKKYRFRLKSFYFAYKGIITLFRSEIHALIHLVFLMFVVYAGYYFCISASEWIAVTIVSGMVFIAEMFNTAIEKTMDLNSKEYHPEIEKIKDLSAGAVLIAAIVAVITGVIIFIPKTGLL